MRRFPILLFLVILYFPPVALSSLFGYLKKRDEGDWIEGRKYCRFNYPAHPGTCKDHESDTIEVGISEELLQTFRLMSQYAAATYAEINNNSSGKGIFCSGPGDCPTAPQGACPDVEAANVTTVSEFENSTKSDNTGFIAVDDTNKLVVLAFRGTISSRNKKVDWQVHQIRSDFCGEHKCKIHKGFWNAWLEARENVLPVFEKATSDNPTYRPIIVGHSLGGAIATIAAGEIRRLSDRLLKDIELYTFGAPRIGQASLVDFLSKQSDKSYRVTSMNDPVPMLPPQIFKYLHTSPEYWIKADPDHPEAWEILKLTGYANSHGNSGTGFSKSNLPIHRHYFGHMSGCDQSRDDSR